MAILLHCCIDDFGAVKIEKPRKNMCFCEVCGVVPRLIAERSAFECAPADVATQLRSFEVNQIRDGIGLFLCHLDAVTQSHYA